MITIIVVSHPERDAWSEKLCGMLDAVRVVDSISALSGHRRALELAAQQPNRCVIMEDDAIPVYHFRGQVESWIDTFPDELISFYLGTSRPFQWQCRVDRAITERVLCSHITLPTLIHGVCYTIPPAHVQRVLDGMRRPEADFAIGEAWGRPVVYPVESLVEHRDGTPVERHPDGAPRTEPRVARALAGPLMYER